MTTTKKKKNPINEFREISVIGDLLDTIKISRYGNKVSIDGCFRTTNLRTLLRVQAAIAILMDELLELGTQTPDEPALVECRFCGLEFYVPKFDPTLTAWYCRDQKMRECYEQETGVPRFPRP